MICDQGLFWASSRAGDKGVKEFLCSGVPLGGRERDNRKIIVNQKRKDKKKRIRFQKQRIFSR
jgi:hypothetical protein